MCWEQVISPKVDCILWKWVDWNCLRCGPRQRFPATSGQKYFNFVLAIATSFWAIATSFWAIATSFWAIATLFWAIATSIWQLQLRFEQLQLRFGQLQLRFEQLQLIILAFYFSLACKLLVWPPFSAFYIYNKIKQIK